MKTGIHWQNPKYAIGQDFTPDPSLLLHLPLHRLDGACFKSKDAYGHLCTVTGALWRPCGRRLDGEDDKIVCGTSPALNITNNDFSLLAWVYRNEDDAHSTILGGNTLDAPNFSIEAGRITHLAKPSFAEVAADTKPPLLTWVMLGVSFDNSEATDNVRFYYNGNADGTKSLDCDFADYLNCIGAGSNASAWYWSGYLGEVWIYNRVLSAVEIAHIYRATKRRYR